MPRVVNVKDSRQGRRGLGALRRRGVSAVAVAAVVVATAGGGLLAQSASAVQAPVGSGFVVTSGDLSFILKQIKIAERHTRAFEGDPTAAVQPNPNPEADPSYCLSMIGSGPNQVPDPLTTFGLRTVAGDCNNLVSVLNTTTANNNHPTPSFANHPTFGAADQPFPRLTTPVFRTAESNPPAFGPPGPVTSYAQKLANNVVFDTQPRLISNLIVDQTSTNPAAVRAAGFPVRAQNGGSPTVPCATDSTGADIIPLTPVNCVPAHQTLFIENVTTDVGLSPPYNSLFTFFGQFFDHGVDQTVKSNGTVIVPLRADDPLIAGPDHIFGNADDLPPQLRFIPLTRAQNQPGPDGVVGTADDVQDATNTDTPWVDQSQTYTSHSSHQVFTREYVSDGLGHPVSTGRFLGGLPAGQTYAGSPDGTDGISSWASTKKQAAELLGLQLLDKDVFDIPMLETDPYGDFIPGPARGLPQYVTATGLVEGDLTAPVPAPGNVRHFDTPFLTDIAHNAEPKPGLTPDADLTASADFAAQPAGTYDNEMLDAHFTCGDGRCNENIALSSIHQVFHSEHNRLATEFDSTTLPANLSLQSDYRATNCPIGCATNNPALATTFTYGQRLFQAARFVTEMEYQHLVFEEFARKVQPGVRLFHLYNPDPNAATKAEFAHAVYRFGHSMLDDDVARVNVNPATNAKTDNSLPLLTAFLNPPEYFNNGGGGFYTPQQAAGAVVMGSSDQAGNELDEFINDTLRNNLLGLPLDLATFNLARARSEGIPPLNQVRRDVFAQTNDGQMTPYTDWSDFGQHLKHPESLINFVAAYGTHSSITAETTITGKRNAARAIVDPLITDVQPVDAADFMFSTGAYANDANGVTTTGLDSVDLWVGGLAEVTNLFGGLLGSTFNYVFQTQLESLQDFDRFYYLARTPGMNLRTQLEGNSFSELIQRNTDNTFGLKADAFATADCKFQLANITFPFNNVPVPISATAVPPLAPKTGLGSVNDDPTTDCDENQLLLRKPDGTIQYRQFNNIDPSGINGQAVFNGTAAVDRVFGGNDNDTVWGGAGNDIIEGNGGDDVVLGGDGNDIITDLGGADVPKGGPGNDAIDGGIGDDIPMGNEGQDFINGGANDNETFAGPGNDFVIAGQGADAVFGDGGDDWIQGGSGQDLLQGDHGAPFFDDPAEAAPGNDTFIGQVGENDYDAEGGDDVMAQNAAVDRNAGAGGFDWAFHQYNTIAADDDMEINNNLPGLPIQVVINRDRWQETEADSGSRFNDLIKGTSVAPAALGGAGFTGCDALDPAGVARITGLGALVTTFPTPLAPIVLTSAAGYCPLTGFGGGIGTGTVWGEGDILLGGGGSDQITGRGADDIIDGDHELKVRIAINGLVAGAASTDLMENIPTGPGWTGTLAGKTLQQAVFAGLVDPGNLVAVREILDPTGNPMGLTANTGALRDCGAVAAANCDTAVFSGPLAGYTIVRNADGSVTISDAAAAAVDGTDTLWNIERAQFADQAVTLGLPEAPSIGTATAGNAQATVNFTPRPAFPAITSFTLRVRTGTTVVQTITGIPANATSRVVTGLTNGTAYTFTVAAVNAVGEGPESALSNVVTPVGPPAAPTNVVAARGAPVVSGAVNLTWTPPAGTITSFTVQVRVGALVVNTINGIPGTATGTTVTGLVGGVTYNFNVRAVNAAGVGPFATSNTVVAFSVPTAPLGTPAVAQGALGAPLTAVVTWNAPLLTGGTPITGYVVTARLVSGATLLSSTNFPVAAAPRSFTLTIPSALPAGQAYRFVVAAVNAVGTGPVSAQSNTVIPR
jgi:Animal haem peroxidase/Fibronectin type III domain/RTX calcium-binding nonapeptide repeat (4 copies)